MLVCILRGQTEEMRGTIEADGVYGMCGIGEEVRCIARSTSQIDSELGRYTDDILHEGATGWGDTWMLATKAPHPNCAYLWTKYVSTPHVQAQQAISFGETPVNTKACAQMESLQAGSCAQYHADAPGSYFQTIKFWKTPIATCPDGSQSCVPYAQWVTAWTSITA